MTADRDIFVTAGHEEQSGGVYEASSEWEEHLFELAKEAIADPSIPSIDVPHDAPTASAHEE